MEPKDYLDLKLSPHFSFGEMVQTSHRSLQLDNIVEGIKVLDKLTIVACRLLEPVREYFGKPIVVSSGFRCSKLNSIVKGAKTSQHVLGEAADFTVANIPVEDVFDWIWKESDIEFGQIIAEGVSVGRPTWVHLSLGVPYRTKEKSGQVMTWSKAEGYKLVQK